MVVGAGLDPIKVKSLDMLMEEMAFNFNSLNNFHTHSTQRKPIIVQSGDPDSDKFKTNQLSQA